MSSCHAKGDEQMNETDLIGRELILELLTAFAEPILERMKEIRMDAAGKMLGLRKKKRARS